MICGATSTHVAVAFVRIDARLSEVALRPRVQGGAARLLHMDEEEPLGLWRALSPQAASNPRETRMRRRTSSRSPSGSSASTARPPWSEEQLVEEEHVPGLEDRPHDPDLAGGLLGHLFGDRPVEGGALGPGRDDLIEAPRNDVHAGGLVAAAREREPDVERAHVAQEGAVLVPAPSRVRIHPPQGALLHRDQRRLAQIAANRRQQSGALEGLAASRRAGAGESAAQGLRRRRPSRARASARNAGPA